MMLRLLLTVGALCMIAMLTGCGGNSKPLTRTTDLQCTIHWAARTRDIQAPASALSGRIMVFDPEDAGGDPVYNWLVVRNDDPAAYEQNWTSPIAVPIKPWLITVVFYANADGTGAIVAEATQLVDPGAGQSLNDIVLQGTVATVVVAPDQMLNLGEERALIFTAFDGDSNMLALSPGSAWWAITSGVDVLAFANGMATGTGSGQAEVTATVDGITSNVATVTVAPVNVTIDQIDPVLPLSGTQLFTATVTGAVDTTVTWSVQEGASGGIFSNETPGLYTAPITEGVYTIVATSNADPTQVATIPVMVVAAVLPGTIAFVKPTDDLSSHAVYLMDGNGTNIRPLTTVNGQYGAPQFNPTGTRVIFTSDRSAPIDGDDASLYVIDVDGDNEKRMATGSLWQGTYNPLGGNRSIAYVSVVGGIPAIYTMNYGAQQKVLLVDNAAQPAYSRDGAKVAFVRNGDLYIMNANGSGVQQVTSGARVDASPKFSPDGMHLIFSGATGDATTAEIYTVGIDGTNEVRITDNTAADRSPMYNGDSSKILFESDRDGEPAIWVMNMDGTGAVKLSPGCEPFWLVPSL